VLQTADSANPYARAVPRCQFDKNISLIIHLPHSTDADCGSHQEWHDQSL